MPAPGSAWPVAALGAALAMAFGCAFDWSSGSGRDDASSTDADGEDATERDDEGTGDRPETDVRVDVDEDVDTGADADADAPAESDAEGDADAPADIDAGDDGAEDVAPVCGNDVVETGEECDGGPPAACSDGTCGGTKACTVACTWDPCIVPVPPGDVCLSPSAVPVIPDVPGAQVFSGTTCGASDDGAATVCGTSTGPDVLYQLDIAEPRWVILDAVGTGFEPVLRVREAGECPGVELACDDGRAGGASRRARIVTPLDPGSYRVAVDGSDPSARGDYTLGVELVDPPAAPRNDTCAGAQLLAPTTSPQFATGTTLGARNYPSGCAVARGPDVWYAIWVTEPTVVYLDTLDGGTWDSLLDVRSGMCGRTVSVECADDACGTVRSRFVARLASGAYYVAVDGRTPYDTGTFTLRYQAVAGTCGRDAGGIDADGTYFGSTDEGDDHSSPSCVSATWVPDAPYFLGLCAGGTLTASTCAATTEFDTVLALARDRCGGEEIACNDNMPAGLCPGRMGALASEIDVAVPEAGLYFLTVDGGSMPGPSTGEFSLAISGL